MNSGAATIAKPVLVERFRGGQPGALERVPSTFDPGNEFGGDQREVAKSARHRPGSRSSIAHDDCVAGLTRFLITTSH